MLSAQLDAAKGDFAELTGDARLAALNARLAEPLTVMTRETWQAEQEKGGAGAILSKRQLAELTARGGLLGF